MANVYLLLGTNLGNRDLQLQLAVNHIEAKIGVIINSSSVYESQPWGFEADEPFYNQALLVKSNLPPAEILSLIQEIETEMGRKKGKLRFESRLIDIDILFYNDLIYFDKKLKIPHIQLHKRRFVLEPMFEIAPNLFHPVMERTIAELRQICPDKSEVKQLSTI